MIESVFLSLDEVPQKLRVVAASVAEVTVTISPATARLLAQRLDLIDRVAQERRAADDLVRIAERMRAQAREWLIASAVGFFGICLLFLFFLFAGAL